MFGLHGCVMNVQCFRLSAMLGHAIFWMHPLGQWMRVHVWIDSRSRLLYV